MTVSRKLTIREIAEELNIAYGSAQDILVNDLGLRRVAAKLVPKNLNFMQKRDRVDIAKDMLSKVDSDPSFIKRRIITGHETWIYEYDTHSRYQASEWRSPNELQPTNPRRFQSKKKVMLGCTRLRPLSRNRLICRTFAAGSGAGQFIALGVCGRVRSRSIYCTGRLRPGSFGNFCGNFRKYVSKNVFNCIF